MPSILSRLFSSDVGTFVNALVDDLEKRLPPSLMNDDTRRPSVKRISRILETSLSRAVEFREEKKLGIYGKAKMANEFRWKLEEKGYDAKFISLATEAMTIYISRTQATQGGSRSGRN